MAFQRAPSPYRYLFELAPSLLAGVIAAALYRFSSVLCELRMVGLPADGCRIELPAFLWWACGAMALYGVLASAWRYYKDFHRGEYWLDLYR